MSDMITDQPPLLRSMNERPFSMKAIDDLFGSIRAASLRHDAEMWDNAHLALLTKLLDQAPDQIAPRDLKPMQLALAQIEGFNNLERHADGFIADPEQDDPQTAEVEEVEENPSPSEAAQEHDDDSVAQRVADEANLKRWLSDKHPNPATTILNGLATLRNSFLPLVAEPSNGKPANPPKTQPAAIKLMDQFIAAYANEHIVPYRDRLPEDYEQLRIAHGDAQCLSHAYKVISAIHQNGNLEALGSMDVGRLRKGYSEFTAAIDALATTDPSDKKAIKARSTKILAMFPAAADSLFDKIIEAYREDAHKNFIAARNGDHPRIDCTQDQHALLRAVHAMRWAKMADKVGQALDEVGYQQACQQVAASAAKGR